MRIILFPFLVMIVLAASSSAQMDPPELMWAREYFQGTGGGKFFHVIESAEGGFIVAGWDFSSGPATHCVYRLDEDGDITWSWDPGYFSEGGDWVLELANGDIIVTGFGKPTQAPGAGPLIARLTSTGSTVWVKCYTAPSSETYCIEPLPDGGYAACGAINSDDSWLLRTDSQGDTLWTRVWDSGGYDRARRVVWFDNGLTVFVEGQGNPANGPFLLRYDMDGDLLWVQEYEAEYGPVLRSGGSMCIDQYAGGYALVTAESSDFVHTDTNGSEEWREAIDGLKYRAGRSIDQTLDGGYVFCGWENYNEPPSGVPRLYYQRDGWLVKLDQMGLTQWHIIYGFYSDDTEMFHSARQLVQGGYIVAGEYWEEGASSPVGLLVRYAPETGIEGDDPTPGVFLLTPSSNPLTSSVTITCEGSPLPGHLMVYDITGRLIRSLSDRQGSSFIWDGRDASGRQVPVGTYMIQGAVDGQVSSILVVRL